MWKIELVIFSCVLLHFAAADIENTLQNLDIPGLQDNLTNLANSINPEEVEKILADKCKKNSGGDEAFSKAKAAVKDAEECVKGLVDYNKLQQEMEKAKPTGDLDLVFKEYCQKSPKLKKCVFDLTNAYEPCMEAAEIETKKTVLNITDSLINFICFKDGDRIALFIAEGGPECLNSSQTGIKECVEKVFKIKVENESIPSVENLPLLLLRAEECNKFSELQKCVVTALEKCSEPTPSNIFDSLFNFVRRHTPCKDIQAAAASQTKSSSIRHYFSVIVISLGLFSLVIS